MPWTMKNVTDRCDEVGKCLIWRQSVNSAGYPNIKIDGKPTSIPRWVLETQLGRPLKKNHCASPSCGDKRCCSPFCLVEKSRSQMAADAYRTGRRRTASEIEARRRSAINQGMAKLTMEKAREIRAQPTERRATLAQRYGVSIATIKNIRANQQWAEPMNSVFGWRPK